MPRGFSKFAAAGFGTCLILLCVVFGLGILTFQPPDPLGLDAGKDVFSAARAHDQLTRLLGDESPHPIGSAANKLVKARLIERLTELGLTPQVQDAVACSFKWPLCGHVENVLARIDGAQPSAILLMAHYDSVPYAPGAGDDGAGVAALLEIARVLSDAPQKSRNSVLFAFTDGEEPGLLGAEAFFSQHAWASDVAAVINVEGSGSNGPSLLLRSGPRSGVVLDAFRSVAEFPVASSFSEELFKRFPNNTDLSVSNYAGKPGVDLIFVGERNHYHTRGDTIANLSLASLQHHGENVLPLVRALANADLSKDAPNYVYTTLTQSLWLAYRPQTCLAISICIIALLGLATWRRWQGPGHFFAALGIVVLAFATIVVFEMVVLALADLLAPRVSWPANPWPWRLIIYATPVVALALQRPLVRRVGFWNTLLAAWWFWSVLTLVLAWYLPLASHLTLPATVAATLVIVLLAFAHPLDRPVFRCSAAIINALVAGAMMLPLAYMGEITQGLAAAPAMFVPLALLAVTLLPLLDRGRVKLARWVASFIVIAGVAWVHWVTLYSEQRPQYVNFTYVVDADQNRANFVAWSPNPLPAAVTGTLPFAKGSTPLPWEHADALVADAAVESRAATSINPVLVAGATRTLRLLPAPGTNVIALATPKDAPIGAMRVDGHPITVEPDDGGYRVVTFVAPPQTGVVIEIDTTGPERIDAFLIDISHRLPDSGHALVDARGQLAVPVHQGDGWVVFRRVRI